jgi:sugar phosphate isomerase/epimerase
VLHPESPNGRSIDEAWGDLVKLIRRWGDLAQRRGMKLALETGFPRSIKDYVRLIQEIDHDAVGSTIDVGHQKNYVELLARVRPEERGTPEGIRAYNDTTVEIIDRLGPKIFHLHIHDIDPQTWQEHTPLVHGFVDYPRLFHKLKEIHYQGLLIFEIGGEASKMKGYLTEGKRKIEKYLREV